MAYIKKKEEKKYNSKIQEIEKAIQSNPNNYNLYLELFDVYNERGFRYSTINTNKAKKDYQLSLEYAQKAYDLNPKDHLTLLALGLALHHNGNPKKAIQLYLESLKINPNVTRVYMLLAESYHEEKNYEKAVEFYHYFIKFYDPRYKGSVFKAIQDVDNIATLLNQKIFPVPIDFSPLRKVIPIGEDIVYSTLAEGKFKTGETTVTNRYVKKIISWFTHVLITQKGMAYLYPGDKKDPGHYFYIDWNKMKFFNNKRIGEDRLKSFLDFYFTCENSSIPLIKSLIINRKKELEMEYPNKRQRKKAVKKRSKQIPID